MNLANAYPGGAGIALEIKRRFPDVYKKYKLACENKLFKLGMIQVIKVNLNLYICNLAGQERYGRDKKYTLESLKKHYTEPWEDEVFRVII